MTLGTCSLGQCLIRSQQNNNITHKEGTLNKFLNNNHVFLRSMYYWSSKFFFQQFPVCSGKSPRWCEFFYFTELSGITLILGNMYALFETSKIYVHINNVIWVNFAPKVSKVSRGKLNRFAFEERQKSKNLDSRLFSWVGQLTVITRPHLIGGKPAWKKPGCIVKIFKFVYKIWLQAEQLRNFIYPKRILVGIVKKGSSVCKLRSIHTPKQCQGECTKCGKGGEENEWP